MTNNRDTYKLIFRSGKHELVISPESDCRLVERGFSGYSSTGFDVKVVSYASNVGGYAQRKRFAEREMELVFEILKESADEIRRRLVTMMNPMAECSLDIEMFGIRRVIDVIPYEEADFDRATFFDSTIATLRFIAPSVFFREHKESVVKFHDSCPMLTFPMNFTRDCGTVSGIVRTTDKIELDNPGDYECGIRAVIKALGGNVVNPGIKCGKYFVKCPTTLSDGEEIIIDTRPKKKNIYKNGERSFNFDKNSTFFTLPVGESTLTVMCDSGGEFVDASIEFTPLYFGM